jgi:streptomycin 6-kinase
LLATPHRIGVLHGDLHHASVLDFGARGWLAIDPKSLTGERGFEFANIFINPDLSDPTRPATMLTAARRRLTAISTWTASP